LVVFTVYEPPNPARDPIDRAFELVFVKDGFTWLAAIVPALWFLVKGLWLELALFLVAATALTWGTEASATASALGGMLLLIVQVVIGFEADAIQGAALERRGWRLVATVAGRDRDDAERRFFETWQPAEPTALMSPDSDLAPQGAVASWTATAWRNAKEGLARGRRLIGAKA
jgi:hypothetical protein